MDDENGVEFHQAVLHARRYVIRKHRSKRFPEVNDLQLVNKLVNASDKTRFEIKWGPYQGGNRYDQYPLMIRAIQGHSHGRKVPIEQRKTVPVTSTETHYLFHATTGHLYTSPSPRA